MTPRWLERDSRHIPAHHQPALLLDLALARDVSSHVLLRGTGLFQEGIASGDIAISPRQFLTLIGNIRRLGNGHDLSFLLGQRALPGHFGDVSNALRHAVDLQEALDHLVRYRALLSPLLTPTVVRAPREFHLVWRDSHGAGEHYPFVVETAMTAVVAMTRALSGARLPWQFRFRHEKPRHVEQYWVHLGERLQFDWQLDMMSLPLQCLHQRWLGASATACHAAQRRAETQLDALGAGESFLDAVHGHLLRHIRSPLSLERVARALDTSPATFKRKLHQHGSHFQEQLDDARKRIALWLYCSHGYSNEQVAAWLQFNDTTNFRRSFKRWTGLAPSVLRERWEALARN